MTLKSKTTIKKKSNRSVKDTTPLHPGVILSEYYMKEANITQVELAKRIGCSHRKINEVVNGKRALSAALAVALEDVFGASAEMWARLQASYDVWLERQSLKKIRKAS